jgi:hypothetical protein
MTIGPAPMIMIEEISVLFGMVVPRQRKLMRVIAMRGPGARPPSR